MDRSCEENCVSFENLGMFACEGCAGHPIQINEKEEVEDELHRVRRMGSEDN